jgi:hypothetical protein
MHVALGLVVDPSGSTWNSLVVITATEARDRMTALKEQIDLLGRHL